MHLDKKKVLFTNLMVNEDTCDSFCKYCYHRNEEKKTDCYKYSGKLKINIDKVINFATTYFNGPIIKICGGEIFLMSNLKELVEELLKYYPYVLIQTNGLHINDDNLKWIIEFKRVLIQISLDGHDLEMNTYRFDKEEVMKNHLYVIEKLKANDVYVELTSVLNNKNTKRFDEFVSYLKELPSGKYNNTLKVTPILVIDKENIFKPSIKDLQAIDGLLESYDEFSNILPPKKYLENLNRLLHGEKIQYQCFNPIVSLNVVDDGKVKGCTNVLPENVLNVGDIFQEEPEKIIEKFGKTKFQKLLVSTKQWVPLCKNCLNFCSIYNLYLNNTIDIEELSTNNYMFGLPEVKQRLIELKEFIDNENIRI